MLSRVANLRRLSALNRGQPLAHLLYRTSVSANQVVGQRRWMSDLVTATTEPKGSNVMIEQSWEAPKITKDGVTEDIEIDKIDSGRITSLLVALERSFERFEDKSQRAERVIEKDFIKLFDMFTRTVEKVKSNNKLTKDTGVSLSLLSAILIRCCGRLMEGSDYKTRELLAGNLWHFIKEKGIPIDISHYNSLIRVLNDNHTVFDPEKILEELKVANIEPDRVTYRRFIHQYCLQGDIAKATGLLEKMKELDWELNEIIFASLIIGYGKQENPPSMEEMFELMKSNGINPSNKSYHAAIISLADRIASNSTVLEELKKVFELVEGEEIQFSISEAIEILDSLNPHKDHDIASRIIDYVCVPRAYTFNSRCRIYSSMLKLGKHQQVAESYWAVEPKEMRRSDNNLGLYYIRLLATTKGVPTDHVIQECTRLVEKNYNPKAFHHLYFFSAEEGNLDVVRGALKKIGEQEPLKCQYFWPLIAQAKTQEEVIGVLKNDMSNMSDTYGLMDTLSGWVWPKFAENVNEFFKINKEQLHFDNNLLVTTYLEYSVQEDKIEEAIKFISEAPSHEDDDAKHTQKEMDDVGSNTGSMRMHRSYLISRLLSHVAEQSKDPALVKKAYNLCKLPNQKVTSLILGPLVKVHILNEDYDGAFETFLEIAQTNGLTPYKQELMIHLLEKKDPDKLQKIIDISTELYGQSNALFDLALACIKCGKIKQAQKILSAPDFRVQPERVYSAANNLSRDLDKLETFIQLTRDLYDVNLDALYQILLNSYERDSTGRRVLDLWNKMQEDEFQPSKKNLITIANLLEKRGISVPFQKPKMRADEREEILDRYGDFGGNDRARGGFDRRMGRRLR